MITVEKLADRNKSRPYSLRIAPFDAEVVKFLKSLKPWPCDDLVWGGTSWRFADLRVLTELTLAGYDTELTDQVKGDLFSRNMRLYEKSVLNRELVALKQRTSTDFRPTGIVEVPEKRELFPYQRLDAEFVVRSGGRTLMLQEMALGKTVVAMAGLLSLGDSKILVVCPSTARFSWEDEVRTWTSLVPYVVSEDSPLDIRAFSSSNFVMMTYERMTADHDLLAGMGFHGMILDEATRVKNVTTGRGSAALKLAQVIPHVLVLTGTAIKNRPKDLHGILSMVEPGEWGTKKAFEVRYCDGKQGKFGWEAKGLTNIDELRERMEPLYMIRKKIDTLKFLPPMVRKDVMLELTGDEKRAYYDLENDKREEAKKREAADLGTISSIFSEMRQLLSEFKLYHAYRLVDEVLAAGEKVIVFSCYNDPLERMKERYGDSAVLIIGKTDDRRRKEAKDRFRDDPECRVFLGGIGSAGEALTLVSARTTIFIDLSFVPTEHSQAEARAWRPGQKADEVRVFTLVCRETIDEDVLEMHHEKSSYSDIVFGDGDVDEEEIKKMRENVLKKLAIKRGFRVKRSRG
jgi:SWI/SNF-related matrix-associated actin-dependent regulator of chromatin subfamily A-like protein 1